MENSQNYRKKSKNSAEKDTNSSPRNFDSLSESTQHRMMRKGLNIDPAYPKDIEFKVAQSPQEISTACAILYEAYTEAGFMIADGSGYRFTVYHALPYCYTLIVKQAGEIIATVTLVIRSKDKLPIEKIFSLSPYLGFDRRVVEVSALTIHPKARDSNGSGRIIFPLLKYLYTFAFRQIGATDLVITCNPKHVAFYRAILLMEKIPGEVRDSYDFVDGAPAVGLRLDLTTMPRYYAETFDGKPLNKDVNKYILHNEFPQFGVSSQAETLYSGNQWTPDELAWMLDNLAVGRSKLSGEDMCMLREAYGPSYAPIFSQFSPQVRHSTTGRVDLNVEARVTAVIENKSTKARILSVSCDELCLSIETGTSLKSVSSRLEIVDGGEPYFIELSAGCSLGNDEYVFQIKPSDQAALLSYSVRKSPVSLKSDQWRNNSASKQQINFDTQMFE